MTRSVDSASSSDGTPAADGTDSRPQRRRRSRNPDRQRDPARTRHLILEAAVAEFGRVGYDGARVIRIAERAGVTHQLITYHFGGKRGLFDALSECWVASSRVLVEGDESLVDVVGALVRQAGTESDWNRALVYTAGKGTDGSRFTMNLEPLLENARKRQARGDFPADLDPGIFSLVLIAANMAPISISHVARARSPVDLSDPAFVEYYAEQLGRLLCHLRHSGVSSRDVE